jgi:hypothetical protein
MTFQINMQTRMRAFLAMASLAAAMTIPLSAPLSAQGTGPEVGDPLPAFQLPDQSGKTQTLDSLMGEKGLLLLIHRSADW